MKIFMDFVGAVIGILFLLPVFLMLFVVIWAASGSPVMLRQRRIGLNGQIFVIYKFRTMVVNAHEMGSSITTGKDARITPIGWILRKLKLDELPQLFNILKGDMSFVGPRPDVPEIISKYTPEMRRVLSIKPGITSLATLHFRNEEEMLAKIPDPDEFYEKVLIPLKVKLAMEHVDKASLLFDLKILVQTVWMLIPLGRLFPVKEHPLITEMKRNIPNFV